MSLVEKYRMDDETYNKRSGTMREWIREKRANDPNYKMKPKGMTTMGAAATAPRGLRRERERGPPTGSRKCRGVSIGDSVRFSLVRDAER